MALRPTRALTCAALLVALTSCSSDEAAPGAGAATPPGAPAAAAAPAGAGPAGAAATAPPVAEVLATAGPLPPSPPVSVRVPSIGVISARPIDLGLADDGTLEVPADAAAVGWFTSSPTPGEVGPSVFAGHVDLGGVDGVFSRLREVRVGDEVHVARADGTVAVFTTYGVQTHPKATFPTRQVYGDTASGELRLITCGGAFDAASGDYLDNVVVYGRLTASRAG